MNLSDDPLVKIHSMHWDVDEQFDHEMSAGEQEQMSQEVKDCILN